MKSKIVIMMAFAAILLSACKKDKDKEPAPVQPDIVKEGIERAELIFTKVTGGEELYAHGDHFHGLNGGVEGASTTVKFNEKGEATANGHLHLEADGVYKITLKAWDYTGKEVQNDFITNKQVADKYKSFLIGGSFILNSDTENETGAIFQPRELQYADGTSVGGKYETTGIVSYFTAGEDNEGSKDVTFVLRKLNNSETKAAIERTDWNRTDYATTFAGKNVLELKFEIHAESDDHAH